MTMANPTCRWLEAEGGGAKECWAERYRLEQCIACLLTQQIAEGSNWDAARSPTTPS